MTPAEALELFRSEMNDEVEPYLWNEPQLRIYFTDAQRMFCRLTDGLSDATNPDVTTLELPAGAVSQYVDLHPSILKIRACTRADTGHNVDVVNYEDLPTRGWRFMGQPGPLKALIIGEEANKARSYPELIEPVTLKLMVFRYPLEPVELTRNGSFEIAEEHHEHLLEWVKHRAFGKQDSETFDRRKSDECEARFRAYCAMVKVEEDRKRHKNRTVAYGGI